MDKHLHIISFDVPYPADYGGVIDVYHKIKALHKLGVKVHLHCYTKGREQQDQLKEMCYSVDYYHRKKSAFSFLVPYIVSSRNDKKLLENLNQDNYPVLMEGIHCSMLLYKNKLDQRKSFLRMHNVEYKYYRQLSRNESSFIKKIFFRWQSGLLKSYENKIAKRSFHFALSKADADIYQNNFHAKQIAIVSAFVAWQEVESHQGSGMFCLYHGNLSVNENENAAIWLIDEVFSKITLPLVIAGKQPSKRLETKVHAQNNICLVSNPSENELQDLIRKAQINVLPSMNNTGVKLKLLNALFTGRHCLINKQAVEGSGLESLCNIASDAESFQAQVGDLFKKEYASDEINSRKLLLNEMYNNVENAVKLIALIH
ncbi:MAG: glycosyltransferase [Ferruginibacter sp.]